MVIFLDIYIFTKKIKLMKISIITVVKNGLPFLKSAIKSIKDQKNIKDVEHIVVYSPSNDGTEKY